MISMQTSTGPKSPPNIITGIDNAKGARKKITIHVKVTINIFLKVFSPSFYLTGKVSSSGLTPGW